MYKIQLEAKNIKILNDELKNLDKTIERMKDLIVYLELRKELINEQIEKGYFLYNKLL